MASQAHTSTTLLGKTYNGRPLVNSLAARMLTLELQGRADLAQRALDAHERIGMAFGGKPYDLTADFTNCNFG